MQLQEWDIPTPGPGQILVKTEACGVCHADLHAANGDWPLKPTPPFIPGHEAIGIVVAHIPKGLGPKEAAPLIRAGITTYKGIRQTSARPGEWIAKRRCHALS